MSTTEPSDHPAAIPPYGERDLEAADRAIEQAEADERHGYGEALRREVAGVIAAARAEGVHEGRADALTVIERMIASDDPEAIVDTLPRAEA